MQFLLAAVNAKYIHTNPAVYSLRAYAGESLRSHVKIAEYTINNRAEEILRDIYKRHPDVIGFSCYIWNFKLISELIPELSKVLPETEIWLGGPEVSFEAAKILDEFPMVSGIMAGEGEETFKELLHYYAEKDAAAGEGCRERLKEIPGLVLREGRNHPRALLDINELPFIYEDVSEFENKIIYYETSRGCPFRCSYCLSSIDKRVRLRSMDKVKRELQFFLDKKVPQVKLIDRTFNCDRLHAMEIWRYIKEHDNGVTNFHFEVAAELLGEEELLLLGSLRPGLAQLEIGVQTSNEKTLKEIHRSADINRLRAIVGRIREGRNIHVHLDLIAGLPYEGYERFRRSFNEVYAMKPQQLQLGFLKVLKGTEIYDRAEEYGIVSSQKPPYEVLYTKWLSYGELLLLKQVEEMVELYHNSGQFTHMLPVLEEEFTDAFSMYQALAAYYEEQGYFINTPARSSRYQVLLEFALKLAPDKEELYRELLTYDYYLRENAKSRPGFSPDLSPYRDRFWAFYEKEEKEPDLLKAYSAYHAKQVMKMTHMEAFFYPVFKSGKKELKRGKEPVYLLFDYQKRDPLTREAKTLRVTE